MDTVICNVKVQLQLMYIYMELGLILYSCVCEQMLWKWHFYWIDQNNVFVLMFYLFKQKPELNWSWAWLRPEAALKHLISPLMNSLNVIYLEEQTAAFCCYLIIWDYFTAACRLSLSCPKLKYQLNSSNGESKIGNLKEFLDSKETMICF